MAGGKGNGHLQSGNILLVVDSGGGVPFKKIEGLPQQTVYMVCGKGERRKEEGARGMMGERRGEKGGDVSEMGVGRVAGQGNNGKMGGQRSWER